MIRSIRPALTGLLALAALTAPAIAQPAAEFYRGKTVTYVVATAPGGGYDAYGRLIARAMERHLPGTRFVVNNVPGAGHIVGANQIFAARADGLTIGSFNTGLIYAQILQREGVRFDLRRMSWIGKAASEARALVVHKDTRLGTVEAMRNPPDTIRVAVSGVGSANYNDTSLLADALGLKLRLVPGHNGQEGELAIMRNEVIGTFGSYSSLRPFVANGFGRFALMVGGNEPGVPQARDYATSDRGRGLVALIESQAEIGRLTAGPPGIPADRVELLRRVYRLALEDRELLREAERAQIPVEPAYGEDVGKLVNAALNQSPETVQMIAAVMNVQVNEMTVRTNLIEVGEGGRSVKFQAGDDEVESQVSGSRTKVRIGGRDMERKDLKQGLLCTITFKPSDTNEPSMIDCRS
jgi:tripartite-type tricarboxylate transporter receptor subunit TctC